MKHLGPGFDYMWYHHFFIFFNCRLIISIPSHRYSFHLSVLQGSSMGLLPDTQNCVLHMRRECRERFPRHRIQRKPLVSGTCVTHVPWCMSGFLIRGGGENVPGIPGAWTTRNFAYLVRGPWSYYCKHIIVYDGIIRCCPDKGLSVLALLGIAAGKVVLRIWYHAVGGCITFLLKLRITIL